MSILRHLFLLLVCALSQQGTCAPPAAPPGMVYIPGGDYKPLYAKQAKPRQTPAFFMSSLLVTNADFLTFVTQHPEWRRSKVTRAMADENYLRHWAGDLDFGPQAEKMKDAPVTNVSWFTARAYCESKGLRLPTQDEWEFAARADATRIDATADQAFLRKLLEWYSQPNTGHLQAVQSAEANVYGLKGLHGLVWEWVQDFNSTMITGESRGDSALERKLFCGSGSLLASDVSNYAAFMRYALRSSLQGTYCIGTLGFRTAAGVAAMPDALSAVPDTATSAYDLKGVWRTQDNRKITLGELKGKPRVLTMGFTSCQYACPRIVSDIQRIETALGASAAGVGFTFVSIDPVRDTPPALAAFAVERKLESSRWTLLSGPAENVRELAVALAFKYQQVNEDFAHSNMIVVLDARGNIVHRTEELDADIAPAVAALKKLLVTSASPAQP